MSYANMFVMPRDLFKDYCHWLFGILFEMEKDLDMTGYSVAETRVFGYLGELLLNVWVNAQKLRIKYVDIVNTESQNNKTKLSFSVKQLIKDIIYFPSGIPYHRRMKKRKK